MENEHLYSFIIKNKVYEPLLLMLTRSFPGIFNEYKTLNEFELSKYLKIPVKEIITQLKRLHQMEVVDVEFGTNLPILRLTENRVKDDYLEIKSKVYFQRKASAEDKLKAILDYVKDNKCRARILVEYFGQSLEKDCGKCDYCLNLNNARITYTVKSCETLIDLITKNNPIVIHDLMKLTNPLKTKETVAKLEWLNENGIIWLKDEWVSLK
jgi:ATP-dependent DNA helicase RecQ